MPIMVLRIINSSFFLLFVIICRRTLVLVVNFVNGSAGGVVDEEEDCDDDFVFINSNLMAAALSMPLLVADTGGLDAAAADVVVTHGVTMTTKAFAYVKEWLPLWQNDGD